MKRMQPPPLATGKGSSSSLASFLLHPCSASHRPAESSYDCNDEFIGLVLSKTRPAFWWEPPMRLHPSNAPHDPLVAATEWARRRGMRVAASGHAIVCKRTGNVLTVDLILVGNAKAKQQQQQESIALACVHYAPSRGGMSSYYARQYMQRVQAICNRDMKFFPRMLSICVYGSEGSKPRVYASDVSFSSSSGDGDGRAGTNSNNKNMRQGLRRSERILQRKSVYYRD